MERKTGIFYERRTDGYGKGRLEDGTTVFMMRTKMRKDADGNQTLPAEGATFSCKVIPPHAPYNKNGMPNHPEAIDIEVVG